MLTTDEIALLRSLVEWRRANGWELERDDFTYISPDRKTEFWPGWGKELGDRMFIAYPQPDPGQPRERVIPQCFSLREAVDVLVAFGLLPPEFSSAFAAGQESAYDGGTTTWAAQCTNAECDHRDDDGPFWQRLDRGNVERYISRQIPGMYELVRQVISPWVRVPEAGGTDGDA